MKGAKVAMHLATSKSDLVERLVVVDMAPVKYSDFKEQDDILHAMMTLDLDRVTNLKVADSMLSPLIPVAINTLSTLSLSLSL